MRIYVDTNVYLDYLLERENKSGQSLDDIAFEVLRRARSCEFEIVLSDHVLNELYRQVDVEQAEMLWGMLKKKIVPVQTEQQDIDLARTLPTHVADALHIVLARKMGAEIVVTRNVADFRDLMETKRPEDI